MSQPQGCLILKIYSTKTKKGAYMRKILMPGLLAVLFMTGCQETTQNPVDSSDVSMLKQTNNFTVHLTGDQEVPPRETNAQGQAIFKLNSDGTELYYKLIAANISNVFMAHIHLADPGVNGGIVVWLYPSTPNPPLPVPPASWIEGPFNGVLAEGVITADDLTGALSGMTIADLMEYLVNGGAYVNVHTSDFVDPANTGPGDFPGGEVRGDF